MNCEDFRSRLSEYLDGQLDDAAESEMLQHAESCPPCQEQLTQTVRLLDELECLGDSVPVPLAAQSAWRKAVRALSSPRPSAFSRFSRVAAGMAAALLVLFGATWSSRINGASPVTLPIEAAYTSSAVNDLSGSTASLPLNTASSLGEPRVFGRMSDGALKKDDDQTPPPMQDESSAQAPSAITLRLEQSASLQMETDDYEADRTMLENIVLSNEGYFELREESAEKALTLHAVVRVPVDALEDLLNELTVVGRTVRKTERAVDVSDQFIDLDERLNACDEQLNKLYLMQTQSQNVDDLIIIAERISECIAEQENLLGRQNALNASTAYATVEIDLTAVSSVPVSERISQGFEESLQWLIGFSTDALVLLVSNLPRLVVLIPALILIVLLICWIVRKRR